MNNSLRCGVHGAGGPYTTAGTNGVQSQNNCLCVMRCIHYLFHYVFLRGVRNNNVRVGKFLKI